jgi:hypothetical protein
MRHPRRVHWLCRLLLAVAVVAVVAVCVPARAAPAEGRPALFALILGVNRSNDPKLPDLRYADDDGARYLDLFRSLGARASLLTTMDAPTRRLHPQAAAEAQPPRRRQLHEAVARLAADVQQARQRGVPTVFYFVYAGHGRLHRGQGAIALEDGLLTGDELVRDVIDRVRGDQAHVIVDACYSYYLAESRGPGGRRRHVQSFSKLDGLARRDHVGWLLSTSSARESHEWEAYQGGVFSHEVRSGLYGAADADGDGRVSYREIAAFVSRANAAIPNERFRPAVFARPPAAGPVLVDLRPALRRALRVDGARHAHYVLEDNLGVRLAEFHSAVGQAVSLIRPASARLYLRRVEDGREFVVPATDDAMELAALTPQEPRVAVRGAAHEAFGMIFSLPFGAATVDAFELPPAPPRDDGPPPRRWRRAGLASAFALAGASLVTGAALSLVAWDQRRSLRADASQQDVAALNRRLDRFNAAAVALYAIGGVAAATGLGFVLWPERRGATLALGGAF